MFLLLFSHRLFLNKPFLFCVLHLIFLFRLKFSFKKKKKKKHKMTVCVKSDEAISLKSQNRNNGVNISRPSFMITDILSKAADKQNQRNHLMHLTDKYSSVNNSNLALNHGFGMTMPQRLDGQNKHDFYDSDADDFHGSDDVDGSSVGSGGEYFFLFFFFNNIFVLRRNCFFLWN